MRDLGQKGSLGLRSIISTCMNITQKCMNPKHIQTKALAPLIDISPKKSTITASSTYTSCVKDMLVSHPSALLGVHAMSIQTCRIAANTLPYFPPSHTLLPREACSSNDIASHPIGTLCQINTVFETKISQGTGKFKVALTHTSKPSNWI